MNPHPDALTAIDLFCGAGGLTLGLEVSGFHTRLAVDNWRPAGNTFRANFPDIRFSLRDASELTATDILELADLDAPPSLVEGGPPCQGFSSAGGRRVGDPRNSLVGVFARLVAGLRPRSFLFENVEGFLTAEGGDRVVELLDPLVEAGYHIRLRKVNAANYGLPQLRKRVVAIGGLGRPVPFPAITHRAYGSPGAGNAGHALLPAAPSVSLALADLPEKALGTIPDHQHSHASGTDMGRIRRLRPGQTMRDLPPELRHPSYRRRSRRRVSDGTPSGNRGGAPAGIRRLDPAQPSKAITSAAIRDFVHPEFDRFLTLRECARIQTFPDWFEFRGSKTARSLLIGNGVPVEPGAVMGSAIAQWLRSAGEAPLSARGSLASFQPTSSMGMSPALRVVSELVATRYIGEQAATLGL